MEKIDMIYNSVVRIEGSLNTLTQVQAQHSTRLALLEEARSNGESVGRLAQRAGWAKSIWDIAKAAAVLCVLGLAFLKVGP